MGPGQAAHLRLMLPERIRNVPGARLLPRISDEQGTFGMVTALIVK